MSLEQFSGFGKKNKSAEPIKKNDVWSYTRVSSKNQKDNNESLDNQDDGISTLAKTRSFVIVREFGKTYESASSDNARKIFSQLIKEVKNAKHKPYAILLNTMSRFSRTGGNAIALAKELVEDYGVHLIEASTGHSTETEEGKIIIYNKFLEARKENLARLAVTIPGMKRFVSKGYRLGSAPRGYTHYGPRVKDFNRLRPKQELKINEEGKQIRQAWYWKLQNIPDYIIRQRLRELGVIIPKASLNAMWRNPFYCGIQNSSFLDGKVIYGIQEKMITKEEFLMVQDILNGSTRFGNKQEKFNANRPLIGHLFCSKCGKKMTGYEVNRIQAHYYKCQHCPGETINCKTTTHSKGVGANDLFVKTLQNYELTPISIEPFKEQLTITYKAINDDYENERLNLDAKKIELEAKLKLIKKNHALGELDKEIYNEVKVEIEGELNVIAMKLSEQGKKISNLNSFIESAVSVSQNLSKYWASEDISDKRRIQNLVFPDGITIDVKNRQYLTNRENSVMSVIREVKGVSEGQKKDGPANFAEPSCLVAGARLELTTFGL